MFLLFLTAYFALRTSLAWAACATLLEPLGDKYSNARPSVSAVDKKKGRFGGHFLILKMSGRSWYSSHQASENATQGDPRWMISLFGEEVAKQLGFELLSAKRMQVPDAVEFNTALDRIAATLEAQGEKSPQLRYYNGEEARTDIATYLDRFVRLRQLPLSPDPILTIHDLSYHYSAHLIPDGVTDLGARQTHYLGQFLSHLQRHGAQHGFSPAEQHHIRERLLTVRALEIDTATGNLVTSLINQPSHPEFLMQYFVLESLGEGNSPKEYLRALLRGRIRNGDSTEALLFPTQDSLARILDCFYQFSDHKKESSYFTSLSMTGKELCTAVQKNRDKIVEALHASPNR